MRPAKTRRECMTVIVFVNDRDSKNVNKGKYNNRNKERLLRSHVMIPFVKPSDKSFWPGPLSVLKWKQQIKYHCRNAALSLTW